MTPWTELIYRTLICLLGVAIGSFLYAIGSNWLRRKFHGGLTDVIFVTYAVVCAPILVSAPFIYLIKTAEGMVLGDDGGLFLGATFMAWILTMVLALFIILSVIHKSHSVAKDNNAT